MIRFSRTSSASCRSSSLFIHSSGGRYGWLGLRVSTLGFDSSGRNDVDRSIESVYRSRLGKRPLSGLTPRNEGYAADGSALPSMCGVGTQRFVHPTVRRGQVGRRWATISASDPYIVLSEGANERRENDDRDRHTTHIDRPRRQHRVKSGGTSKKEQGSSSVESIDQSAGTKRSAAQGSTFTTAASQNKREHQASTREGRMSLPESIERMSALLKRRESLPPAPLEWLLPSSGVIDEEDAIRDERSSLFGDTVELISNVQESIRDGKIRISGKHIHSLSDVFGNALIIYSESPPPPRERRWRVDGGADSTAGPISPYEASMSILNTLYELNLDIRQVNYACAVRAACHEWNWKEAANLFKAQTDPDEDGLVPMDPALGWDKPVEMGLYAIARSAQEDESGKDDRNGSGGGTTSSTAGERVFDAALSMTMVSPSDQENYILAAGSALGRAGEWEACLNFLKTSYHSSKLGQPLVAAVMKAFIECSQFDQAVELYGDLVTSPSVSRSEWQWGGGSHALHPLCRDLALRSFGGSTRQGMSKDAVELFEQIVMEQAAISVEAVRGIFMTFERDGDIEMALRIFDIILDATGREGWKVVDDTFDIPFDGDSTSDRHAERQEKGFEPPSLAIDDDMLACIMRLCNSRGEFGVALVYERVLRLARLNSRGINAPNRKSIGFEQGSGAIEAGSEHALVGDEPGVVVNGKFLSAMMTSLCGVGCFRSAARVYEIAASSRDFKNNERDKHCGRDWSNAFECHDFARSMLRLEDTRFVTAWECADTHIHRLISVGNRIRMTGHALTPDQEKTLMDAVAKMMHCCTEAGQPMAGLLVARKVAWALGATAAAAKKPSVVQAFQSFLGIDATDETITNGSELEREFLCSTDSLLAATMKAHRAVEGNNYAVELFFSTMDADQDMRGPSQSSDSIPTTAKWVQSTSEAVAILVDEGRTDDAEALFRSMGETTRTPATFLAMAQGFANEGQWELVGDVYHAAVRVGGLTEEIGLLAMQSVVQSTMDGKIRILRAIADDLSRLSGTSSKEWLKSRYWTLKRQLGLRSSRLLMWWNDARTVPENELNLALEQFERAKGLGLMSKNDVLRRIVHSISHNQRSREIRGDPVPDATDFEARKVQQKERSKGIDLITQVLLEARRTELGRNRTFIDEVAAALRALKGNVECIEFVRDVASRGIRANRTTFEQAILAAEDEGDVGAVKEMMSLLMGAGHKP